MYLFRIFYSFLPLRNPIGFGASDLLILAIALLLILLLLAKAWLSPYLHKLASRTLPCMALLFIATILLRLALLPTCPEPVPSGADDFGYLLLADTLAHFRFANPSHPLYPFFESVFILQQPAYASIYPLGQGLVLAFGQIMGHPWLGVLVSGAAFCAFCYWMLRAWVAPVAALIGGILTIAQFGPLNPWMNSYWGGYVSATAGCLVFGALPRLTRSPRMRYGLLLGAGLGLQILSRPFESSFLLLITTVYLAFTVRAKIKSYVKPLAATCAPLAATLALMLLQNHAVTHNWTTMPYQLSRYQYGVPATFTFQPNPVPQRPLTAQQDLDYRAQSSVHGSGTDSPTAYTQRLIYRFRYLRFFLLPPLYLALLFFIPSLRQRRWLWVSASIALFAVGSNCYPYFYPHYLAAIAGLLILLAVNGLQRLSPAFSSWIVIVSLASFCFWFALYAAGDSRLLPLAGYQSWNYINQGDPGNRRAIDDQLRHAPGRQIVFVRYSPYHRFEEWIHNAADISTSQTIWANDLGPQENQQLLRYYPDRTPWLLEPDRKPPALKPYENDSGSFLSVH